MQKKLDKTNKNGFVETTNRKIKIIEQRRARQTLIPSRDTVGAWVLHRRSTRRALDEAEDLRSTRIARANIARSSDPTLHHARGSVPTSLHTPTSETVQINSNVTYFVELLRLSFLNVQNGMRPHDNPIFRNTFTRATKSYSRKF